MYLGDLKVSKGDERRLRAVLQAIFPDFRAARVNLALLHR